MARLTITLPDPLHRALKQAAVRRERSIGAVIAESLESSGIKSEQSALEIVREARERSRLTEADAMELALTETRRARSERG